MSILPVVEVFTGIDSPTTRSSPTTSNSAVGVKTNTAPGSRTPRGDAANPVMRQYSGSVALGFSS